MKKKRPILIDLNLAHFPPMGIASIVHRVTGVFILLSIPMFLWFFQISVNSSDGFLYIQYLLHETFLSLLFWLSLVSWLFHIILGLRHLWMDMGFGESLTQARYSALVALGVSVVVSLLMGIWLWHT